MTDYVVGDIQGCYKGLKRLLKKIQFNPNRDRLIAVGDLIARGEDSLSVLQFCNDLDDRFMTVLGNHDLHLLAISVELRPAKPSDRLGPLLQYAGRDTLYRWLRNFPLAWQYDANTLISHAGLYPAWSFADATAHSQLVEHALQGNDYATFLAHMYGNDPVAWSNAHTIKQQQRFIVNAFTRMRYVTRQGGLEFTCKVAPHNAPQHLLPWFQFYNPHLAHKRVLFGHWASLQGRTGSLQHIGLDTGYVWGNAMSCLNLDTQEIIRVTA
jgi:bis(5'-nucleosyl)-tetraphosphatase (symmetrical)